VAAGSKPCVYALSLPGITGSNPAGSIEFCVLCLLFVAKQNSRRRAETVAEIALRFIATIDIGTCVCACIPACVRVQCIQLCREALGENKPLTK
jgi:hypothetical protein